VLLLRGDRFCVHKQIVRASGQAIWK
jgi:hypothetical protein